MIARPLLRQDLDHVLIHAEPIWRELAGTRLFVTGGTGFFGKWLLESIAYANDALGCDIKATILTRNSAAFLEEMPHLKERAELFWLNGDVTNFAFPIGRYDFIFHLATFTSAHLAKTEPMEMLARKFSATKRILDFARHCSARRLLVTSSGAVYGPQPSTLPSIPEDYAAGPDPLLASSAYGNGKRLVEQLCSVTPEVDYVIARCFSFIGPHLPLNARFAAGNFVRDALTGNKITVSGNGDAIRTYLYAADLVVWLVTLLIRGKIGAAYNVGGNEIISIRELACRTAEQAESKLQVVVQQRGIPAPNRYVPNISRAATETGLRPLISVHESIARTLTWSRTLPI